MNNFTRAMKAYKEYREYAVNAINILSFTKQEVDVFASISRFRRIDPVNAENAIDSQSIEDVYFEVSISLMTAEMERAQREYYEDYFRGRDHNRIGFTFAPIALEFESRFTASSENGGCFDRLMKLLPEKKENIWFHATIRSGSKEESLNSPSFNCIIGSISASIYPYYFQNVYLSWSPNAIKDWGQPYEPDISQLLNFAENQEGALSYEARSILDKMSRSESLHAKVFNVGQASFSYINSNRINGQEHRIMFDLGQPTSYNMGGESLLLKRIIGENVCRSRLMRPDIIIVSHWHTDHFLLGFQIAKTLCDLKRQTIWIAPKHNSKSKCTNNLMSYLITRGALLLVDGTQRNSFLRSANGSISLWQGTSGSNDWNNSGIILSIRNALFTGDCGYDNWPSYIVSNANKYNHVIAPHHGAKMSKRPPFGQSAKRFAYISAGNNGYGHPNLDHIKRLETVGFDVKITKDCSCDYFGFTIS